MTAGGLRMSREGEHQTRPYMGLHKNDDQRVDERVMADSTATTKRGPPRTDVDSCCPKRVQGLVPAEGLGVSPNSSFLYPPRMGASGLMTRLQRHRW